MHTGNLIPLKLSESEALGGCKAAKVTQAAFNLSLTVTCTHQMLKTSLQWVSSIQVEERAIPQQLLLPLLQPLFFKQAGEVYIMSENHNLFWHRPAATAALSRLVP